MLSMELDPQALSRAKQQAYRFLAYRNQTSNELKGRLLRRGHMTPVVDEVLRQLEIEGYIDDRKFALDWARYRLQAKPLGRRRLSWELQRRGMDREVLQEVLRQVYAEFDEVTLAAQVARRQVRRTGPAIAVDERQGLTRVLIRLGFDPNTIATALAAIFPSVDALDIVPYDDAC
jgi:regulatory protein